MNISGQPARFILEQMGEIFDFYLSSHYNLISAEQIESNIVDFRQVLNERSEDPELEEVLGFVSQSIPYLQVAANLAIDEINRELGYYQHMEWANVFLRQARNVITTKLGQTQ